MPDREVMMRKLVVLAATVLLFASLVPEDASAQRGRGIGMGGARVRGRIWGPRLWVLLPMGPVLWVLCERVLLSVLRQLLRLLLIIGGLGNWPPTV